MTELVLLLSKLLISVRSLKETGVGGVYSIELEIFGQPLSDVLTALADRTVESQPDGSRERHKIATEGAIIIVRDTLFRLDFPHQELPTSDDPTARWNHLTKCGLTNVFLCSRVSFPSYVRKRSMHSAFRMSKAGHSGRGHSNLRRVPTRQQNLRTTCTWLQRR